MYIHFKWIYEKCNENENEEGSDEGVVLSNNRGKSTKLAVCINILDKMVWFGPIICFSESKAEL